MRHSKYGRVRSASGVRIACEVGIYVTVLRRLMRAVSIAETVELVIEHCDCDWKSRRD